MIEYPEARRHIDGMFELFTGRKPPTSAYKQALFPQGSRLIPNPLGTAMGAFLELDNVLFATLPGVPAEMQRMFEDTIESLIRKRSEGVIVSLLLRFAGISEEELGEKLQDLLDASDPTIAPLVGPGKIGPGEVDLRLTTRASTREEANKKIAPVAEEILRRLSEYYLGQKQG
jgi:nicotinamide-nucleotide amidase